MTQSYDEQISQIYPNLTKSERKVADYVRNNMPAVLHMNIRQLKEATGVSEPTIFRFCRGMGYTGFKEFKISMAQRGSSYKNYFFSPSHEDATLTELQSLVQRMLYSESQVIETTLRFLDYDALETVAKELIKARRICLFGTGTSFDVCSDAQRKMLRLGLNVWAFNEFHNTMFLMSTLGPEDIVFCVSHSGITPETEEILKIAHAKGVKTTLMTSFPNTPMTKYAQWILRTYGQETSHSRTAMASRIGQYALFDALYMTMVYNMGEGVVGMMEQTVQDTYKR